MYTWHENLWFIFFACCWSEKLTESHNLVGLGTVRYPVFSYHTLSIPKQCTETLVTHILTALLIKPCLCDGSVPPMGPYLTKKKFILSEFWIRGLAHASWDKVKHINSLQFPVLAKSPAVSVVSCIMLACLCHHHNV